MKPIQQSYGVMRNCCRLNLLSLVLVQLAQTHAPHNEVRSCYLGAFSIPKYILLQLQTAPF